MANAPDELSDILDDLERALTLIEEKTPGYILGKEMYEGTRSEVWATAAVEAIVAKSAKAAPISLAHIPVDVLTDKVELASLTAKEKPAADILARLFDENDLDDEGDDWTRKACYFGDYYVIINPVDEDDETGNATQVDLVGASPLTTIVMYDRKNDRVAEYGVRRWQGGKKRWHAIVYYDDVTVKLITAPGEGQAAAKAKDFQPDVVSGEDPESYRISHEGGVMLIEHLAIDGKPYGVPVHKKAFGPQDAITKISATNLANVDGQGFAARWALADPTAEIDDDITADFGTDGPGTLDAKKDGITASTTGVSRVRSVPGAIALLRGVKAVGQFDATTSDDFLKNLDWYVRIMAVATGIPLFEFDMKGEQPSGEARRRAEGRSNKHARKIQRAAAAFYKGIADKALAVQGITAEVTATFRPLETSTDKDGLELVASKISNGIPVSQALREAGYTDEQVAEWFPEGEARLTPGMLAAVSTALKDLGAAITLDVITQRQVNAALPWLFAEGAVEPTLADPVEQATAIVTDAGAQLKAKADAVGILVRAGADPEQAAKVAGLEGLTFPNVPVTVRIPEAEAVGLEGGAPAV